MVSAVPEEGQFPNISFKLFSQFVKENFSSGITLSQVLLVLFTITDNHDLLNLHARQQNPRYSGENHSSNTGWLKSLARALQEKLGEGNTKLFKKDERKQLSEKENIDGVTQKLDGLAKLLDLYPYDSDGQFQGKIKAVSYKSIKAAQVICPISITCETTSCNPRSLLQNTRLRDIPRVTLIKGSEIYENVQVLTGYCPSCQTTYHADHERVLQEGNRHTRVYLNSAKYLKVGQSLWVDRVFSNAVVNGMYSFHASASAFTEYWNNSSWRFHEGSAKKITRRQVWQSFVQESVRSIAAVSNTNIELQDSLNIDEVTKEAFNVLGERGIIRAADQHECDECTQPYKSTSDTFPGGDPARIVGVDQNVTVPQAGVIGALDQPGAQGSNQEENSLANENDMDIDHAPVKMVVLDGIVMGPQHCAYDNCTSDLANARGGSFCAFHENQWGARCRMHNCNNEKVPGTQACQDHAREWDKHVKNHSRHTYHGARRQLQRPGENLPWQPAAQVNLQPHDESTPETRRKNYFSPSRFYCVETLCAPCGTVIAWAKFAKSESPTNILNFLETVYPTEESRPAYICIDKACLVLRTAIANGSWDAIWKKTTRFIVDAYHYINHRLTDYLCRRWCNPAPQDGSAPNLVIVSRDNNGQLYLKRAFNTQACEQLNAWLGGFESILKRMTPSNFDWFLHTMLFYHTRHVLEKQKQKNNNDDDADDSDEDDSDEEID
jgi:CxC5 like cysteine cluster associated with KDZ transposases/CxC6 like cysteine cluster associated with KDZ transposases